MEVIDDWVEGREDSSKALSCAIIFLIIKILQYFNVIKVARKCIFLEKVPVF